MKKKQEINRFLVGIFNEILKTEELFVSKTFNNLSVREIHVIEAVCNVEAAGEDNRSTSIAERLKVTAGTLTTAVVQLERKGYLIRERDQKDKRIVHILPTSDGRQAQQYHMEFHKNMVDAAVDRLTEEETEVFVKALDSIAVFFRNSYCNEINLKNKGTMND